MGKAKRLRKEKTTRKKQAEMQRLAEEMAARATDKLHNTPPELIELALVVSGKIEEVRK